MNFFARSLLAAEEMMRGTKVDPGQVRTALFLEYRLPLGCVVHLTPAFEAVKRSRPEIAVVVATTGLGAQVLRHSRFVDELIDVPDPTVDLGHAVLELRRALKRRDIRPDCVLTGASDQRTRIALLGLLGSPGWRAGFTQAPRLYQRPLAYNAETSLIANNLRVARLLECEAQVTQPHVFFSQADADAAAALLHDTNPDRRPLVAIVTQTSGGQNTRWHTERFVRVIRYAAERGFAIVYPGTSAEAAGIEEIHCAAGGVGTSIAGKTTVNQLTAVLASSDFMITLDTGPMHVGRAAGVPMVVLGPSWQKPIEWMPLGVENARILRGEDRSEVPAGYCLDEITADAVIAALDKLTETYPASAVAREARMRASLSEVDHRCA